MKEVRAAIKEMFNCEASDGIYDCLRHVSAHDLVTKAGYINGQYVYHPQDDGDFFPSDASEETYKLTQRYLVSCF